VNQEQDVKSEGVIIGEVQLILAEKRTSLAVMRTGIAVLVLPLSALGFLIATSEYYDIIHVWYLLLPLLLFCTVLLVLGAYLIIRSVLKIRHQDRLIEEVKRKHSQVADFLD
jgi:uncharacterized membrane protein YkgB